MKKNEQFSWGIVLAVQSSTKLLTISKKISQQYIQARDELNSLYSFKNWPGSYNENNTSTNSNNNNIILKKKSSKTTRTVNWFSFKTETNLLMEMVFNEFIIKRGQSKIDFRSTKCFKIDSLQSAMNIIGRRFLIGPTNKLLDLPVTLQWSNEKHSC